MRKAFKFKLKVTRAVSEKLTATVELCRELYNAALQERREAYKECGLSLNYYDQANQLKEIKTERPDVANVHSQVLQDVLKRMQKAFDAFFRRIQSGEKEVGYPRFKGKARYNSFTYPQGGWKLEDKKLTLSKIGSCLLRQSRSIEGEIKTVTIKRDATGWYVIFSVECDRSRFIPNTGQAVGVDVGIENFATLSNGEKIENPRHLRRAEKRLKTAQRNVSRKKGGGQNRTKAVCLLAKQHLKIKRQRLDFLHKTSLDLIRKFDEIAVEELNILGMVKNRHLAKSIVDASWGTFLSILESKAEEAGRRVWKVNARNTSQECSSCGTQVKKSLRVRFHCCPNCGLQIHRDHNAAININARASRLGMREVALSCEPSTCPA